MNKVQFLNVTPVIDTNIYASGDNVGGKLTIGCQSFRNYDAMILRSVMLVDKAKQSVNIDLVFFDEDPAATTFTNNVAQTIADADLSKIVGVVNLTSYAAFADNSVGFAYPEIPLYLPQSDNDMNIYCALIARATPTYASTSDLLVTLGVEGR